MISGFYLGQAFHDCSVHTFKNLRTLKWFDCIRNFSALPVCLGGWLIFGDSCIL